MDDAAVTAYLQREYPEIIAEVGIDLPAVIAAVNDVLFTRPTLDPLDWANPLADYFLLRRALRGLANRMRIGISGDSYALKDMFDNVKVLYGLAESLVAWLVVPVSTPSRRGFGSIEMVGTLAVESGLL